MINAQYARFVHELCTQNGHQELEPFYECIMESTTDVIKNITSRVGKNPMKTEGDSIFDTSINAGYEKVRNPEEEKDIELKKMAEEKAKNSPEPAEPSPVTNQPVSTQAVNPESSPAGSIGMDFGGIPSTGDNTGSATSPEQGGTPDATGTPESTPVDEVPSADVVPEPAAQPGEQDGEPPMK